MKTAIPAAILALTLYASAGAAADLSSKKSLPVYAPPVPVTSWTGFYGGLNAGYTFPDDSLVYLGATGAVPAFQALQLTGAAPAVSINNDGFIGGGQIGYNWQFAGPLVAGLETDIQGVAGGSKSVSAAGVAAALPFGATISRGVDYLGTVRGRLGWSITPTLLLYGAGGLAYGQTNLGVSGAGPIPFLTASRLTDTRVGWTAGGGFEWMFLPQWSAKAEYLYYNLGSAEGPAAVAVSGGALSTLTPETRYNGHVVRAGANYHFNWALPAPIVGKY